MKQLSELVADLYKQREDDIAALEDAMQLRARDCPVCGKTFKPGDTSQRYCKLDCYRSDQG
jgi:hypothetical protein